MAEAVEPREMDFALVGGRGYVRATDVLRELIWILPSQTIAVSFRRPLRGPAVLTQGYDCDARAVVRSAGSGRYSVVAQQRKARRTASRPRTFFAFCFRAGTSFLVFTGPGSTAVERIESCFELGFARLPQRYFVRTLIFHGLRGKPWGLIWFCVRRSGSDARCVMRTFGGPLAELRFFVRKRNRSD